MVKLTLSNLTNLSNEASAVTTINNNSDAIETAIENTLSRDGTSPNSMSADLDLNGFDIVNVGNVYVDGDVLVADTVTGFVDFDEISTPSAPGADTARLYAYESTGTRLAYKDSANVVHPLGVVTSTDNAITRFDGTGGGQQNSDVTLSDANVLTGAKVLSTGSSTSRTIEARFADIFNVRDYGAVGDGVANDTSAISAALTAIGANNAALYFPTGTYLLTPATITKTLTANQSIKIYGDGTDNTVLYFNSSGNGLSFTFTTSSFSWIAGNNLIMEDLSFVANVNNTGSAVVIDGNCTIGNPNRPTVFNRVGFRGTATSNSCWAFGLSITDLQNVEVNDCYFFSSVLGVVGTGIFYTGTSNSEHPTVLNVHNWQQQFGEVGIHCTGFVEGLNVVQSNFTQTNYGVLVDTTGSLPMFSSTGSQYNCNLICIQLTDCAASQIVGNLMFTNAANAVCISANNPYHTIVGNTFVSNAATCTGILLQSGATDCCVSSNVFKSFTTNIWIQSGATNNVVGRNRHADGTPVLDQATGTIYNTETSSTFSPGATDGSALGTTALMWSDLFLASGGVINWNNGDVTATHASNTLTFAGADTAYDFQSDEAAGTTSLRITNANNTGVTTKLGALQFHGVDTISGNKEVIRLESVPADNNWVGGSLRVYTRASDALSNICTFGTDGSVKALRPTGGLGYGTGAGGTVTQITSRTTGVTLNKVCGQITMFSAAGSTTPASFTVTNSAVEAGDTPIAVQKSGTNKYYYTVTAVAAGSFEITFSSTGGTATDAPVINFSIIKAVTA